MEEKVIRRERVFDGELIKLDVADVTTHNDQTHRREIVTHPGAVGIVAIEDGDVLLVRQFRLATGSDLLEIPAGTLEPDENPARTAERELQEEIHYRPEVLTSLGGFYVAPGYSSEYLHLYLAAALQPARLAADDDEFIEVVRLPFTRAIQMIEQNAIHDAKTVAGLLRAARHLGV